MQETAHVRTYQPTVADRMECWCDAFRRGLADRVAQLELADNPPRVIDVDLVAVRMVGGSEWHPARTEEQA